MKLVVTKKVSTNNLFFPSFLFLLDPGSEFRDPGVKKFWTRDKKKHHGSATLIFIKKSNIYFLPKLFLCLFLEQWEKGKARSCLVLLRPNPSIQTRNNNDISIELFNVKVPWTPDWWRASREYCVASCVPWLQPWEFPTALNNISSSTNSNYGYIFTKV